MFKNNVVKKTKNELEIVMSLLYLKKFINFIEEKGEISFIQYDTHFASQIRILEKNVAVLDDVFNHLKILYKGDYTKMELDTVVAKRLKEICVLFLTKMETNIKQYKKNKTTYFKINVICDDKKDLKNKDLTFSDVIKVIDLFMEKMDYLDDAFMADVLASFAKLTAEIPK